MSSLRTTVNMELRLVGTANSENFSMETRTYIKKSYAYEKCNNRRYI